MGPEKQKLLALIKDYQAAVVRAVALLNAKSEQEPGFQRTQQTPGVYAGFLDEAKQIRYAFHGIGCLVTAIDFEVDFDFGTDGRCDGIDPWFVFSFQQENTAVRAAYSWVTDAEQVRQLILELAASGLLQRGTEYPSDSLFYLPEDLHNPQPPRWQPVAPTDEVDW